MLLSFVFFFKQKTAYEMRISDWSSDVCSSDLRDHNAAALRAVLEGKPSAYRDIVVLGSAAALIVAGKAETLEQGATLAADAIDGGGALDVLNRLVRVTNMAPPHE